MHRIIAALFTAAVMAGPASASDKISTSDKIDVIRPVREFVDSLVVCNIATMTYSGTDVKNLVEALNLVTGWDYTEEEAAQMSLRVSNLFRVFNIRHGLTPDLEIPSAKYGSAPVDGPLEGKSIMPKWKEITDEYYRIMGWDRTTGKPLPATLKKLGLESIISDIW